MINVSAIKQHMYCPMKIYNESKMLNDNNINFQSAFEMKKLKIEIQDIIEKNMRKTKKEMALEEIEKTLYRGIESAIGVIKEMDLNITSEQIDDIIESTELNIKVLALKLSKSMKLYNKDGFELTNIFFPNRLYSYLIKDESLGLTGNCEKIEIVDGKYYPVVQKNSKPPFKGVWDADAVELAAYAVLIEEEFDCDVYVGFVDYEKICERRTVVIDVNLRKALFEVMHEIRSITENNKIPHVNKTQLKCSKCEYRSIC